MFKTPRIPISELAGATEIGRSGEGFDHIPASTWLFIARQAIESGIPDMPVEFEGGSHQELVMHNRALEEHRMSAYGQDFILQRGQPTLRGIVGLLERQRQELGKQYTGSINGISMFSSQSEQSHFLEFLRETTGGRPRHLKRAIGSGLSVIIDMQTPPVHAEIARAHSHHALMQFRGMQEGEMPHSIAEVVLNANPDHEYVNVFTAAPFTGKANLIAVPGALGALLLDAKDIVAATTDRLRIQYPDK